MTKWTKPNGKSLELNDQEATINKALEMGWKTDKMIEDEEAEQAAEAKAKAAADKKAAAEAKAKAEAK